ncbi:MAG: DUF5615 family PIN-like protein [Bacteroidota bacterium]
MLLLLADENFPFASYKYLVEQQYDIKHIAVDHASIKDYEVINIAIEEERIILTFDSDFGELIFKLGFSPKGVVFFRWKDFKPRSPGEYLHELIVSNTIQLKGYLTVIDEQKIRQRKIGIQ